MTDFPETAKVCPLQENSALTVAEDMGDDVERKGLGTPATRADIIEKLVKDGFVKREKKQIIPTCFGGIVKCSLIFVCTPSKVCPSDSSGSFFSSFSSSLFNPDIKRVLNSKKVTDHHAIIPTMEIAKADLAALPETERRILSLIANRLLCATGEKHLYETVKAEFSCNGHTFSVSGKAVTHNGWKLFEDAFKRSFKSAGNKEDENGEKKLPELSEGQTLPASGHFPNRR